MIDPGLMGSELLQMATVRCIAHALATRDNERTSDPGLIGGGGIGVVAVGGKFGSPPDFCEPCEQVGAGHLCDCFF